MPIYPLSTIPLNKILLTVLFIFTLAIASYRDGATDGGIAWTAVTNSKFSSSDSINAIAYGNGKFVAVGDNGKMAYSIDGVTWTVAEGSKFSRYIFAIAYGNGKFVAVGFNGKMAYSSDGITWTAAEDGKFSRYIFAITYSNGKFVAVGFNGKMAYSIDGVTWTVVADSTFGSRDIYTIAYSDGKFVAVSYGCKIAYSTDFNATVIGALLNHLREHLQ